MKKNVLRFLGSQTFLYVIVALFTFEALWIALTGRYPGAFDENFHFGLIQIYSHHWLPFLDAQPPDAGVYGAITRDPSYFYHYLMSFPYRLINLFIDSQTIQIIILRVLNVGLAVASLLVYARILKRTHLSSHAQHAILVLFTMIPVLSLLAGQLNYDNLLLLLVSLAVLLTMNVTSELRAGVVSGRTACTLLIVCALATLTKYAFLPIFVAIVLFIALQVFAKRKQLVAVGYSDLKIRLRRALKQPVAVLLLLCILILMGLGFQRYGINVVRYHSPIPDCDQVISVDECLQYAPWGRDYHYVQNNTDWTRVNVVKYANMWIHQILRELYFTIYAAFMPNGKVGYHAAEPLPLMIILGWTVFISGTLAMLVCSKRLWRDPTLRLFGLIIVVYVGILFVQNYKMYVRTAIPVAIHGRYLLPLLPLLFVLYFRSYGLLFGYVAARVGTIKQHGQQVVLTAWALLLLVATQGSGFLTHIVRSDSRWFWQESSAAQKVNDSARTVLKPLIIEKTL